MELDRLQFVAPVHATRGINVSNRNREDEPPRKRARRFRQTPPDAEGPSADDVVAMVDRLQERVEVRRRPRIPSRRDQYDRMRSLRCFTLQNVAERFPRNVDDSDVQRTAGAAPEHFGESGRDRFGLWKPIRTRREDDGVDAGAHERFPAIMGFERIGLRGGVGVVVAHREGSSWAGGRKSLAGAGVKARPAREARGGRSAIRRDRGDRLPEARGRPAPADRRRRAFRPTKSRVEPRSSFPGG